MIYWANNTYLYNIPREYKSTVEIWMLRMVFIQNVLLHKSEHSIGSYIDNTRAMGWTIFLGGKGDCPMYSVSMPGNCFLMDVVECFCKVYEVDWQLLL